ncbi:MAG: PEP-CTERM sorting domain-containing protein, partial [Pirellulaceae bacterium]|nr:PEP-CTERM sorting domain-containing protein [Pirellulaceae bacterium]
GGQSGGMYMKADGITPTGSVLGDLSGNYTYWLRLEQTGGNPQPVPEPSSIAIFSVVGIGGLMLRRRMMKKKS